MIMKILMWYWCRRKCVNYLLVLCLLFTFPHITSTFSFAKTNSIDETYVVTALHHATQLAQIDRPISNSTNCLKWHDVQSSIGDFISLDENAYLDDVEIHAWSNPIYVHIPESYPDGLRQKIKTIVNKVGRQINARSSAAIIYDVQEDSDIENSILTIKIFDQKFPQRNYNPFKIMWSYLFDFDVCEDFPNSYDHTIHMGYRNPSNIIAILNADYSNNIESGSCFIWASPDNSIIDSQVMECLFRSLGFTGPGPEEIPSILNVVTSDREWAEHVITEFDWVLLERLLESTGRNPVE